MSSTTAGTPATDETSDLIASDKVEGTAVYNAAGDRLGTVHNFMVGKPAASSVSARATIRYPGTC